MFARLPTVHEVGAAAGLLPQVDAVDRAPLAGDDPPVAAPPYRSSPPCLEAALGTLERVLR